MSQKERFYDPNKISSLSLVFIDNNEGTTKQDKLANPTPLGKKN